VHLEWGCVCFEKIIGRIGYIILQRVWKEKGWEVIIVNVYTSCDINKKKKELWEKLKEKKDSSVKQVALIT